MNLYVEFNNTYRYLNLKPINPDLRGFSYYRLDDGRLDSSDSSFTNYMNNVTAGTSEISYYLYTTASTIEELYTLHPELFI